MSIIIIHMHTIQINVERTYTIAQEDCDVVRYEELLVDYNVYI